MSTPTGSPNWHELPLREAYPFGVDQGLSEEISAIRDNRSYRSWIRRGFVTELFSSQGILQDFIDACWPHGDTADGKRLIQRYLRTAQYYHNGPDDFEDDEEDETFEEQQFAYESNLRDFLADNLSLVEPGLELFQDDQRDGVEYPISGGRIDILAKDRSGRLVVIELKLSRGRNITIGQLTHYMGWVDKNLPIAGKSRGIIIANEISDDLMLACERVPDVSLYEYTLSVQVDQVFPA